MVGRERPVASATAVMPPPPDGHRFAGSPATPHFVVQHRAQRLVFVPYGGYDL